MNNTKVFLSLISLPWIVTGDLFTATSDLELLLDTQKKIIDDLALYIAKDEQRLMILKRYLNIYRREHEKAIEDIPDYLENPINAFTLIKRLTTDLEHIEKVGTEYIKNLSTHPDVTYPTAEDLTGAAQALTRLQDTYLLDVRHLSEGVLNGVVYSTPMTSSDCYELGRALYEQKDYNNTLAWMTEALRKYGGEGEEHYVTDVGIMYYIGYSHYLLGDIEAALEWTKRMLAIEPTHERALGNAQQFEQEIAEEKERRGKQLREIIGEDVEEIDVEPVHNSKSEEHYEALCRGEMDIPEPFASKLICYYQFDNHAFLRLAPFKVEQMYIKPDVLLFHEVLSDSEIDQIKDMAKPRLQRALVRDSKTSMGVVNQHRVSKSGWLSDRDASVVSTVTQRVSDMTALDMSTAEMLQVANYGIGGHYGPHCDFIPIDDNTFSDYRGNRIATVLFYMSDVAQGGATVFTELGLSVFPMKNAAVFWMNLHPSGEGNLATLHAACPVLQGSKWVCNKWIHQYGQELLKPCNLEYQQEGSIINIPKPVTKLPR